MRRPALKRWLERELKHLTGTDHQNLRLFAQAAQSTSPRAVEPLLIYAVLTGRTDTLMRYTEKPSVVERYRQSIPLLESLDLEQAALSGDYPPNLDRGFQKHLRSFAVAYHAPENVQTFKETHRRRFLSNQKRYGFSIGDAVSSLGLNPANTYAFLSGELGRLSLDKAKSLARWSQRCASQG